MDPRCECPHRSAGNSWGGAPPTAARVRRHYDVINIHTYAQLENWPAWRRSFTEDEDPGTAYLKDVEKVIAWRDRHAPVKKIWITEFGWDSTTKPNATGGTFKDWVGNTDEEQAVYLVRSTLVFAGMGVDRAYVYFFNDSDEPKLHAASGLTRDFVKKTELLRHAVAAGAARRLSLCQGA